MARPPSARVDWRPYRATALVLVAALALDVWAGNALWFWYTIIGTTALLVVVGCIRTLGMRVPNAAAWAVGVTAALHYLGGSLSSLRQIGGANGLYYAFPWWDNVTHVMGAAAVGIAAFAMLPPMSARARGFLAVCVSTLVGVLIELYEFAGFVFFGTIDQGYYTNNTLDLYYNLLGAVIGVVLYARLTARVQTDVPVTGTVTGPASKEI